MKYALLVTTFHAHGARCDEASVHERRWLDNVLRAMDAAVRVDAPILLVRQVAESVRSTASRRQNPLWGIPAGITQRNWGGLIDMCGRDFFAHPGLVAWLAKNSIEAITLCGDMGKASLEAATQRASQFGYSLEVLADATCITGFHGVSAGQSAPRSSGSSFCEQIGTADWVQRLGTWRRWTRFDEGACF